MTLTLHEHPFASFCWKALIALSMSASCRSRRTPDYEK